MEQQIKSALYLLLESANPGFAWVVAGYIFILFSLGFSPIKETKEAKFSELSAIKLRQFFLLLFPFLSVLTFCFTALMGKKIFGGFDYSQALWAEMIAGIGIIWATIPLAIILPWLLKFIYLRHWKTAKSNFYRRFRATQTGDQMTDIRVEQGTLASKQFDPRKLYKPGYFLVGLSKSETPIYITEQRFLESNLKIIGPTQSGKGVTQGVLLDQSIKKGLGAWFIDLKPDDFIYDIMYQACEEAGRPPPIVVDLNGKGTGSYHPFVGGSIRERYSRLYECFGLLDGGTDADHYKINERKALNSIRDTWDGTLAGLQKALHPKADNMDNLENMDSSWIYDNTTRTRGYLSEWRTMRGLNPEAGRGLGVKRSLEAGAVVYIRGSMTDSIVQKATTSLIMELIQTVLEYGPLEKHTFVAVDELRFLINEMIPKGLASVLSKNMNMSVAYQTVMDLKSLDDKNLNGEAIRQQVEVNTPITICHRAQDFETAEWAANLSGTQVKTVSRMEEVNVNKMGGEEWADKRTLNTVEENLLSTNTMLQLPKMVGAFFQPNEIAEIVYTCWIPVEEKRGIPLKPVKPVNRKPKKKKKPIPAKTDEKPKMTEEMVNENVEELLADILPSKALESNTQPHPLDHLPDDS